MKKKKFTSLVPSSTVECLACGKKFKRPLGDAKLNPHKMQDGFTSCPGTVGKPTG